MRAALLVLAACSGGRAPPPAAPPVPIENTARGCSEAAAGLERATRGFRPPEESILAPMRRLCVQDSWSGAAIDCFATMTAEELGKCAGAVDAKHREALFGVIAGNERDMAGLQIIVARLANLRVGISECDRFVIAVSTAMSCERLPLEQRHDLGNETADFWSLPTRNLPPDAIAKMVKACSESLDALQQQVAAVGCM
ncbi:MAG: hypothetical protein H0T46_07435 [Deltaproteobacteria bacterium]|nr:hypothetical protein [Deltaproteobacteria bacterium]